jgi:hypothetical protein
MERREIEMEMCVCHRRLTGAELNCDDAVETHLSDDGLGGGQIRRVCDHDLRELELGHGDLRPPRRVTQSDATVSVHVSACVRG